MYFELNKPMKTVARIHFAQGTKLAI